MALATTNSVAPSWDDTTEIPRFEDTTDVPSFDDTKPAYETSLSPSEEGQFQGWKSTYAPNDSGNDYDLRGAFKAGLTPSVNGHWPDTYKKPNHPTFSDESIYAKEAPNKAGSWNGETFIPPKPTDLPTPTRPEATIDNSDVIPTGGKQYNFQPPITALSVERPEETETLNRITERPDEFGIRPAIPLPPNNPVQEAINTIHLATPTIQTEKPNSLALARQSSETAFNSITKPLWEYLPEEVKHNVELDLTRGHGFTGKGGIEEGVLLGFGDLLKGMTSPIGISTLGTGTLPKAAQKVVSLAFAAQMASQVPEIAKQLNEEFRKPDGERDNSKIARLMTNGGLTALGFGAAALHGVQVLKTQPVIPKPNLFPETPIGERPVSDLIRNVKQAESPAVTSLISQAAPLMPEAAKAAEETGNNTTVKESNARNLNETATENGNLRPQPIQGEGAVPAPQSSGGVQPLTEPSSTGTTGADAASGQPARAPGNETPEVLLSKETVAAIKNRLRESNLSPEELKTNALRLRQEAKSTQDSNPDISVTYKKVFNLSQIATQYSELYKEATGNHIDAPSDAVLRAQSQPKTPTPLGLDRPDIENPELRKLSDEDFDFEYKDAKKSVNQAEKMLDEVEDIDSLTEQQRQQIAAAQDRWTAADLERTRRNYSDTHTEDVFHEMINLADKGSESSYSKFRILANILKERGDVKPTDVTAGYGDLPARVLTDPDFKEALGGKMEKFKEWLNRVNEESKGAGEPPSSENPVTIMAGIGSVEPPKISEPAPEARGDNQAPSTRGEDVLHAAVEKRLMDETGELPTHEKMNIKDETSKAIKLIESDPERALRVAKGEESPSGVRAESVYTALEEKSMRDGDVAMLQELANSKLPTAAGQNLKLLDSKDLNSPVKIMRDIRNERQSVGESRFKTTKAKVVTEIKKTVRKSYSRLDTWESVVAKLACN